MSTLANKQLDSKGIKGGGLGRRPFVFERRLTPYVLDHNAGAA